MRVPERYRPSTTGRPPLRIALDALTTPGEPL